MREVEGTVSLFSVDHRKATSCWLSTERLGMYLGSPLTLKPWSDYGPGIGSSCFNCSEDTALFCSRILKMWVSFLKCHSGSDARYPAAVHIYDTYQCYLLLWALLLMTEKLWTFGSAAQGHSWLVAAQIRYNNQSRASNYPTPILAQIKKRHNYSSSFCHFFHPLQHLGVWSIALT